MIGVTPLADDDRYQLQAAALQTTSGTFIAPNDASLEAAGALLQSDTTSGTWPIPYPQFEQAAGQNAYPGSMVVYAAIPTSGLPAADAKDYAALLNFAATTGQTQGYGVGQLPPGYLPLTAADGLGALASYTQAAATDVAAQNGQVPSLTATATPSTTGTSPNGSGTGSYNYAGAPYSGLSEGGTSSGTSSVGGQGKRRLSASRVSQTEPLFGALSIALWAGGLLLLIIVAMAFMGMLGVPVTYLAGRRRGRW
jgi:hypothetical protein